MNKVKFDNNIRKSIIFVETIYIFMFGYPLYKIYIENIGANYNKYVLLVIIILYLILAIRHYQIMKATHYEDYFDKNGQEIFNKKVIKSKWERWDKQIYFMIVILGFIL